MAIPLCFCHMNPPITTRDSRRSFLRHAGGGLGLLALASMLAEESQAKHSVALQPHFPPRVKRVIWLFMHGGPSHVDLFDPKPDLTKFAGQPLPDSFGMVMTRRKVAENPLLPPVKPFQKYGQSGLEISEFLPEIAQHADELCVLRSLHGDSVNHPQAMYQSNTGSVLLGHPSVGSWISYGLGSENRDLPAFVVLPDPVFPIRTPQAPDGIENETSFRRKSPVLMQMLSSEIINNRSRSKVQPRACHTVS